MAWVPEGGEKTLDSVPCTGCKAAAVVKHPPVFLTPATFGPVVRKGTDSILTPPRPPTPASSLMPSSDASRCPALR